jgi:NAD(P)-dependent dehydrogenase (short-subunit alcohol dehydrogenase family)
MLLDGRVCVVAGVGAGLGREVALALAGHGATVVLGARTASVLEEVADEIAAAGGRARAVVTNVVDPDQCDRLVRAADEEFGRVDALVNCAYRPDVFQRFEDVDLATWRKLLDLNLFGSLQLARSVLPAMQRQGSGSIVFVSSMVTRRPLPLQSGYAISKGALNTAARALAGELGPYGIRVNTIVPGWMWGPNVELYVGMTAEARGVDPGVVVDEITADIPLGRIPDDGDVAGAAVYLVSDLSRSVTGQSLDVNGGEYYH